MEKVQFTSLTSRVVPISADNIDTDVIVPARYLKVTDKQGLAKFLFADWRENQEFILNKPEYEGAQILLAGDNFGCGSSREHAPWALIAWGFRAVISSSFADIFRSNALKNGLLPVVVEPELQAKLFALAAESQTTLTVDLASQQLTMPDGTQASFPVDPFAKHCLLQGIDQLEYLSGFEQQIADYEARR